MFIVTCNLPGYRRVPLRGTIWAHDMDRAQKYETREAAQAALDKARKFMAAKAYKAARVEEIAD